MSRDIIRREEGYPLAVNTFAGGVTNGECVQVTRLNLGVMAGFWRQNPQSVTTMTREQAIRFFEVAAKRLRQQVEEDHQHPPWWQKVRRQHLSRRLAKLNVQAGLARIGEEKDVIEMCAGLTIGELEERIGSVKMFLKTLRTVTYLCGEPLKGHWKLMWPI